MLASLLAWAVFQAIERMPASVRARQVLATADDLLDLSEDADPDRDHIRGSENAPVTLVEYGDYECSYDLATLTEAVRKARARARLRDEALSAQVAAVPSNDSERTP